MATPTCRFCEEALTYTFADLGMSPLANSYLMPEQLNQMERFYPLHAYVCHKCFLVQLQEFETPEGIFSDYAYFSSYSDTFLEHAKSYVEMAIECFQLTSKSQVIEIASNDGYLLQYFIERGIPVLGIEPAANVAKVAMQKGIPSVVEFFGTKTAQCLAKDGRLADLLIGNNVLAHVPQLNDFVGGLKVLLKQTGVITMEFPHLLRLIGDNLFDTIYHEHFSYFSLHSVEQVFKKHGLAIFDVEEVSTHGGSLRIYAQHAGGGQHPDSSRVADLRSREMGAGFSELSSYLAFAEEVAKTKRDLLAFLIAAKENGKVIVGYGAPAKGNTLLNYCGIRTDFLEYTVDRSPHKQGRFLPGVHIPVNVPEKIHQTKPDYVLILPWNLKDEIMEQMAFIRGWGGRFVVPLPKVKIY
jgi:2-polyprenyl-3-methyl-5-hydroxy-6-metoxy-1,4-benzoquinol methylase